MSDLMLKSNFKIEDLDFTIEEIYNFIYDGLYISDGTGKTIFVNDGYLRITGLKREDLIGKKVHDLQAEGIFRNAVTPEVLRLKKQVHSIGESACNHAKMLITGNPVFDDDGNIKLVVVTEREITDLLQMQIELEAIQQKMKVVEVSRQRGAREVEHLRDQGASPNMVFCSGEMQDVMKAIRQVAHFNTTVLIEGETGVGKEIVATEIQRNSPRRSEPFIKVNCSAIPATLIEAELFGYEKGAFTGAAPQGKIGLIELADKGTLLLDEIGDMPFDLQSKLLRVLQEKELIRIGGTKPRKLDVRIIAATHRDLRALMAAEKFREDLYYRLSVFPIRVPPLRDRPADLAILAEHFTTRYNAKYMKRVRVGQSALDAMTCYGWPGNTRELKNVIERLVLISEPEAELCGDDFAPLFAVRPRKPSGSAAPGTGPMVPHIVAGQSLKSLVADIERRAIETALSDNGSTRRAAQSLQIDQSTVVKKAKRLGIDINRLTDEKFHR